MTLKLITEPTVEPLTVQEVMAWSRLDASNQEPAPGVLTCALASPATPGNIDNGAHRYLATFTTSTGETQAGTVSAAATVADKAVNGQVNLTGIPLGGSTITGRKIYRTAAGGSTYLLLATLANNSATTYIDNIADAALGAAAPSVNTTSDPQLAMAITAARKMAENITGRALITQTWDLLLDAFPRNEIELGKMPLQSVTSVKYYDPVGVLQTLSGSTYAVDDVTLPAWIMPAYGLSWPTTYDVAQAVAIRFVAGYGATGADVPAEIRMWISAQVAAAYNAPDGFQTSFGGGKPSPLPFIDGLLDAYRLRWL